MFGTLDYLTTHFVGVADTRALASLEPKVTKRGNTNSMYVKCLSITADLALAVPVGLNH